MTEISKFNDVIDSRDVIARIEELEAMRRPWLAGSNMPGYMPADVPTPCKTFADACACIIEDSERVADFLRQGEDKPDPDAIAEIDEAISHIRGMEGEPGSEYGNTIGDYHYWISAADYDGLEPDDFEELKTLRALAAEGEQAAPDWHYGEILVRDSYFEQYAQQLADDCCPWPASSPEGKALQAWPYRCIDWEQAARELQQDYTPIEFDDVTYWVRS